MTAGESGSFEVRIWGLQRLDRVRGAVFEVRWLVAGRKHQRTFTTKRLAESFRATLLTGANHGQPFDTETGLPATSGEPAPATTWLDHAMAYVVMKWPNASPRHRMGIADALTTLTPVLVIDGAPPDRAALRRALNHWAFNAPAQSQPPPDEYAESLAWIRPRSLPISDLADPIVLRRAFAALSVTLDGSPAAKATIVRKRATFNNALEYAVELGVFDANPLRRVRFRLPKSEDSVDRRVVVNPEQARALLAAVRKRDPALEGFFACLYFAGLRPAEARNLRATDFTLPESGWGSVVLTGSHQYTGPAWTDSGRASEERELKHRSRRDIRRIPVNPELVETLRRHLERFQLGVSGRLFVTRTRKAGVPLAPPYQNPVSTSILYSAWHRARVAALSPDQVDSLLARRPYDLRHACLSTWLNAGVPPAEVAAWAGHGVDVLLRVYSKCIDGQEEASLRRIDAAMRRPEAP